MLVVLCDVLFPVHYQVIDAVRDVRCDDVIVGLSDDDTHALLATVGA